MISSTATNSPRIPRTMAALAVVLALVAATMLIGAGPATAREAPAAGAADPSTTVAPAAPAPPARPAPAPEPAPDSAPPPAAPAAPGPAAPAGRAAAPAAPAPAQAAADVPGSPISLSIADAGTVPMTGIMSWTMTGTCYAPQGCAGATVTMEVPSDILRATNSMTFPVRNEPQLRYTVSRSGTTVTLRFTEFAANTSFAQAITMATADHTWSVGEKTIAYRTTLGAAPLPTATARGNVTGNVDSRVYKSILTAGPYYPGKIITYRVGIERKQGTGLTGMNSTYVDELPPGVEFIGFVDEDLYERNLRGTNGNLLDPMTPADRERFRPYRYADGKITTVIDDRNDFEARWTNYPSIQYRVRVTDAALNVDSRNTITQTQCTLIHTAITCAPQQNRTATATFRSTPPPPGGTIAKTTSIGFRVGAASRDLGYDLRYTNTSTSTHDIVFRDVPQADSLWDPYSVTLVEANDGANRTHDLVVEYFENRDFSGSPAETITVAGAGPGATAPARQAKPAGPPDGSTKYKAVRVTVKNVVSFESVLVRIDGRTFIPPGSFRPTATASEYTSRNDLTVTVDGTPVPISQTNPAPLVRTAGYQITQELARPLGAVQTSFNADTNVGTALLALGGTDGPRPEGFLFMPAGFTFGGNPSPSWLPNFPQQCPYPSSAYRFEVVGDADFPEANRPDGVGEILRVSIDGNATPNPRGTAPHGCYVPVPFYPDGSTIRGQYDNPDLTRFDPSFGDPANAHLPRPELWVRDVGIDGGVVPLRAGVEGKWGLEENIGLTRTNPATPGQAAQWHMTYSTFNVIPSGHLGISQEIAYSDSTAPPKADYGRFSAATVIDEGAYVVSFMAAGTLPMYNVVGYDLLPAANTLSMLADNPFQSELYDEAGGESTMVPVLTGRPTFVDETNTHPRFRLWYSLNDNPCRPESGGRGCDPVLGFNQNSDWLEWDADPVDVAAVKALRVEFLDPLTGAVNMVVPMSVPATGVDGEPIRNGAHATNRAVISGLPEGATVRQTDGPVFAVLEYQKPSATLQVTKLGYDDGGFLGGTRAVVLDGAVFAIHAFAEDGGIGPEIDMGWQPGTEDDEVTTVSTAEFYEGRYWLVETRSPAGYELLPRPVAFELTRDKMLYDVRLLHPEADSAVAMAFMNVDRDTAKFDIADFTRGELPLTGGGGAGPWVLAGAVLLAMAVLVARVVRE